MPLFSEHSPICSAEELVVLVSPFCSEEELAVLDFSTCSAEELVVLERRLLYVTNWTALVALLQPVYETLEFAPASLDYFMSFHATMQKFIDVHDVSSSWSIRHNVNHGELCFLRAKLLYNLLQKLITDNLLLLTNESPCNEAKFLDFVQDAERHFKQKAMQMHNMLTYFNTYWVKRLSEDDGRKYDDIFEIHRTLLLANLATNIQVKVRDSAFKFILNGGSLNTYEVIRWIATSPREPSQASMPTFSSPRRPIFLLARKLEQSASTRPATERSCPVELMPSPARPEASRRHRFEASRIMTLMATFGHWALFIGPADCSTDNSKLPPKGGLLCELERDEDGYISMSAGPVVEGSLYGFTFSVPTGYTTYSDEEIQDIVIQLGMPRRYSALSNNCQAFCETLLRCIKSPDTVAELQSDYMELPLNIQNSIMHRRHLEHIPKIYEQISKGDAQPLPKVDEIRILPVKTLATWAKFLVAVALFSACCTGQLYLGLCVAFGILINLLEWDGLCRLRISDLLQERKCRPYGEYQKSFKDVITEMVKKFYRELVGDTQGLPELHDWEPQIEHTTRGWIPRACGSNYITAEC